LEKVIASGKFLPKKERRHETGPQHEQ